MGFLESYKRLDNLCKDLFRSEKGVSSYIDSMEQYGDIHNRVQNWDYDYKQLKHYRHIRNLIAHDNSASENNTCKDSDTQWIKQFHQRILSSTDPLALYEAKRAHAQKAQNMKTNQTNKSVHKIHNKINNSIKDNICNFIYLLITIIVVFIVLGIILTI